MSTATKKTITMKKKTINVMKKPKTKQNNNVSTISPVDTAPPSPTINKSNVESGQVVPSAEKSLQDIPTSWKKTIEKQQEILAKKIADHFNIDFAEIMKEVMPEYKLTKQAKKKRTAKKKREKLTDYKQAVKKEDLKDFKMPALKEILQANNLPVGGNKPRLIDRVWGILHPEEAPEETPKKKRGRKKKNEKPDPTSIDSTLIEQMPKVVDEDEDEDDGTECELDFDEMPSIFVNESGKIAESGDEYKLFKDKFLFRDNDEEDPEFVGIKNGNKIEFTDEHPQELLDMLGCE